MNFPREFPTLPEWLTTTAWVGEARAFCRSVAAAALAPEPQLTVSQWADRYRRLSSKASAEPGKWSTTRTPYLREIMDAMTPSHPSKDNVFRKGTQIGGSEALYNAVGYCADQVPCPIMLVMPTTETGKRVSRQRLQPMIEETPVLTEKFSEQKSRNSANTVMMKDFAGGLLVIAGANSGPGLRSMPMRIVLQDEIDAYPDDVDGEGDPCVVADKRSDQFARAKRAKCSTPKLKGGRIDRYYESGSRARYHVPCPHCGHLQPLEWEQMRWKLERRREYICGDCGGIDELAADAAGEHKCGHCEARAELADNNTRSLETDELERVWYECIACAGEIEEHHKGDMLREWPEGRARHIHERPGAGQVLADDDPDPFAIWARVRGQVCRYLPRYTRPLSWHVSALYSPLGWFSWYSAVKQYLEAERGGYNEETGESYKQVFDNTVRGIGYEVPGEQPKVNILRQRAEGYEQGKVPADGLRLYAFCDVQGDRLEVEVDAFGEGEESWTIDYQVIPGDPSKSGPGSVWEALSQLRAKKYDHAGGQKLEVVAMGVDSGYLTQDVYDFCRKNAYRNIFATKGDGGSGKAVMSRPSLVDINHQGKKIKRGVQLFHIGTDTVKERLYKRLDIEAPGAGYVHLPRWVPDEYFDQLTAEKLIRRTVRGVEKREWIKTRERNEALDLKCGCYAIAVLAGLQRINWSELRRAYNPEQRDLFVGPREREAEAGQDPVQTSAPPEPSRPFIPPQPRGGGFVNRWRQ